MLLTILREIQTFLIHPPFSSLNNYSEDGINTKKDAGGGQFQPVCQRAF